MTDFFSGKDELAPKNGNGARALGFVLLAVWCLLPVFGLGMLVGALVW